MDAWIIVHGTDEQRRALMDSLPSLPIGTAWFWSPGWPTADGIFTRVRVRQRETFDSSATPKSGERRVQPKVFASVDLAALKEKMSATIERAKQDDPKALRAEIGTLRKQNAQLLAMTPKVVGAAVKPKTIKVGPIITKADARDIRKRLDALLKQVDRFGMAVVTLDVQANVTRSMQHDTVLAINELEKKIAVALSGPSPAQGERAGRGPVRATASAAKPDRPSTSAKTSGVTRPSPNVRSGESRAPSSLGKGERATLLAIAQRDGASRSEIILLTGLRASSVTTYIQRLRQRALVEQNGGGAVIATPSGLEALGDDYEPLPTGDALREYWLQRLPAGERAVFEVVLLAWPRAVTREEITSRTPYTASSVVTYLQRLSARRLVEGGREIIASAGLFD